MCPGGGHGHIHLQPIGTVPRLKNCILTDCIYSYFRMSWNIEAFSLCVLLLPNLRVVPHGMKGTGPKVRHETSVLEVPAQEQHEHSFYSSVLCTRYTGIAHHRALQTSGQGWADSKAVHRMECSGARSLY